MADAAQDAQARSLEGRALIDELVREVAEALERNEPAEAAAVVGAGAIVDRPQERIAGYQGDAAQVVIAGFTFDPATVVDVASPPAEFPLSGD